jgi:hypothetical protein
MMNQATSLVSSASNTLTNKVPNRASFQLASFLDATAMSGMRASCNNISTETFTCSAEQAAAALPTVTRCRRDAECRDPQASCMSPSSLRYPGCAQNSSAAAAVDFRCACASESSSHCDFVTGMCAVGPSPYSQPPLTVCPSNGKLALVDSSPYFDAMCYVTPLWKCRGTGDMGSCRRNLVMSVRLPELCRSFCEPSPFNDDNQLSQINGLCVCEIGVSVANATAVAQLRRPDIIPDFPPPPPPPPGPPPRP